MSPRRMTTQKLEKERERSLEKATQFMKSYNKKKTVQKMKEIKQKMGMNLK